MVGIRLKKISKKVKRKDDFPKDSASLIRLGCGRFRSDFI